MRIAEICDIIEERKKTNYIQGKDGKMNGSRPLNSSVNFGKVRMSKREYTRVSHQIATEFPNLKADGTIHRYCNRNHQYFFSVKEFGLYEFHKKSKLK